MRKNPSSLVAVVRLNPAPLPVVVVPLAVAFALRIVNSRLGTKAPVGSLTEPSMLPLVSWPNATADRQITTDPKNAIDVRVFLIFSPSQLSTIWLGCGCSCIDGPLVGQSLKQAGARA